GLFLYSSFIGGTRLDAIHSLAMHPSGDVVLFGETDSWSDFPAVLPLLSGFNDAECFIARVNSTTGLVFSSLFPGDGTFCGGVAVNPLGEILVTGASGRDF